MDSDADTPHRMDLWLQNGMRIYKPRGTTFQPPSGLYVIILEIPPRHSCCHGREEITWCR